MASISEAARNRAENSTQLPAEEVAFIGDRVTVFALLAESLGTPPNDDWNRPPSVGLLDYHPAEQIPPPVGLNHMGPIYR